jgi:hypothetical protein
MPQLWIFFWSPQAFSLSLALLPHAIFGSLLRVKRTKRSAFVNAANRNVAEAVSALAKIGDLANADKYEFTRSDLEQIFTALDDQLLISKAAFAKTLGGAPSFRLSQADLPRKRKRREAKTWKGTFDEIVAKRDFANFHSNLKGKLYYSDAGADYLLEQIARVMHLDAKPAGIEPRAWAITNQRQVMVVDASRVVLKVEPTLQKAPQNMIRGRLASIYQFAPEIGVVGYCKCPSAILGSSSKIDPKFAVVLFRQSKPLHFYSLPSNIKARPKR